MGCDCDKGIGQTPDGSGGAPDRGGFPGALYVLGQSVVIQPGQLEQIVFTLEPAAAIDVFVKWRDPTGANATDPDGGTRFRIYGVQNLASFLLDQVFAGTATVNIPASGRALAIRDYPSSKFEVKVDGSSVVATSYYDICVVGWAKEPTGLGPIPPSMLQDTVAAPLASRVFGLPLLAVSTTRIATLLRTGVVANQSAGSSTDLNVLPASVFQATPATRTDGVSGPLLSDAQGNIKVVLSSGATGTIFPAATALGDTDANPTTTRIGADVQWWDGTQWVRAKCGVVAAGTPTGWGNVLSSGVFNTVAPTLTNGQGVTLQLTSAGNLKGAEQFQAVAEDNANGVLATVEKPLNATTYNATASDTITVANAGTFKTSAGTLYKAYFTNSNAAGKIYALVNKASAPVNGDVPLMYFRVPATTTFALEFRFGKRFSTGIAWAEVTAIAATITLDTADTVANAEVA